MTSVSFSNILKLGTRISKYLFKMKSGDPKLFFWTVNEAINEVSKVMDIAVKVIMMCPSFNLLKDYVLEKAAPLII